MNVDGAFVALPAAAAQPISALSPGNEFVHPAREPIFNVPLVVLLLLAAMALVHAVNEFVLSTEQTNAFLDMFAFVPARYDLRILRQYPWTLGWGAAVWTFVTYAFIHGSLMHLGFNAVWLLAFGPPVARRFGPLRFLIFFLAAAAVGAAIHLAVHHGEPMPLVGASAAISGAMAAAMRFAFERGGPLSAFRSDDDLAYRVPAPPLSVALRDPRLIAFVAAWVVGNLFSGLGGVTLPGQDDMPIAWEAHIGGFLAGLVGFALFDPVTDDAPSKESIEV